DPVGDLVLEGQVIDGDEAPVAGATVFLSSRPPRTETTGEDGTFAFDRLVGKRYLLTGRADDQVGGPVSHLLSAKSDPVVLRLGQGATMAIEVVSEKSGAPVGGAAVAAGDGLVSQTGADGKARLRGVGPGWQQVTATAPGHARGRRLVEVPDSPGIEVPVRITLRGGAPVTGVVVDAGGRPVEGARVTARDAGDIFPGDDPKEGIETNAKGEFTLTAVAAGTQRF